MTRYSVKVNDPALPQGAEVEVPGLGVLKNKSTRQLTEEEAEYFRTVNAQLVDVEEDDRPAFTGAAGVELRQGPTVLQAFKDHPTVTVEKVDEDTSKASAPKQQTSKQSDKPVGQDNEERSSDSVADKTATGKES